jgi:hypothetical protein
LNPGEFRWSVVPVPRRRTFAPGFQAILFGTNVAATPLSLWERVGVRVQAGCRAVAAGPAAAPA